MPSIKLRTCARTHISIGSNQSSKSWALVQAAECNAADFVLLLPMAWSPPAWQRRNRLGWTTRRLRHFQFLPTPGRHRLQNRIGVIADQLSEFALASRFARLVQYRAGTRLRRLEAGEGHVCPYAG